jgi:hypothetical protein
VTAGRYFSKSGKLFSVAGAPAANQTGLVRTQYVSSWAQMYLAGVSLCDQVYVFTATEESFKVGKYVVKSCIPGEQVGEYFGAALATGDINGDGIDDLVIGAPFFTNIAQRPASQNEGRVFVYLGDYSVKLNYLQRFELEKFIALNV